MKSLDNFNVENFANKKHNIILVSKEKMNLVTLILKNTKHVHLLVSSDVPLPYNKEWNIIMQQKINGRYLILIKKVLLNNLFC